MALTKSTITAPAITSWATLGNSTTAVASSAAVTVGTSANIVDHQIMLTLKGPSTVTASASTIVSAFIYASIDGTVWTKSDTTNELIDGTDKAITWSANGNQAAFLGSIAMTTTTAGTSVIYTSRPFSLVGALGLLPNKYVIVIQNQSGAALVSGHAVYIQEVYYT